MIKKILKKNPNYHSSSTLWLRLKCESSYLIMHRRNQTGESYRKLICTWWGTQNFAQLSVCWNGLEKKKNYKIVWIMWLQVKCNDGLRFLYPALGIKSFSDSGAFFTLCWGNNFRICFLLKQSHSEGLTNLLSKIAIWHSQTIVSVSSLVFKPCLKCTYLVAWSKNALCWVMPRLQKVGDLKFIESSYQ